MRLFTRVLLPPGGSSIFTTATTPAGRPAPSIVLDLDETTLWREGGLLSTLRLYAGSHAVGAAVGHPYPHAIKTLHALAQTWRIVAVTARWSAAEARTAAWLASHGLGGLPLVHSTRPHPGDASRIAFKTEAIRGLREAGWDPLVGIGDRPSDRCAYAAAGVRPLVVCHAGTPSSRQRLESVAGIDGVPSALLRVMRAEEAEQKQRKGGGGGCMPRPPAAVFFTDVPAAHKAAAAAVAAGNSGDQSGDVPLDALSRLYHPTNQGQDEGEVQPVWLQIAEYLAATPQRLI